MSRKKHTQDYKSKQLIDELSKMPPMVIATAYLHAINYTTYGVDVTEKWLTATHQASALEEAYHKGYYDAMQRKMKDDCISKEDVLEIIRDFGYKNEHEEMLINERIKALQPVQPK